MARIAVVGAGISGLGAARFLAAGNEVVLFEAEARLGGHARTIDVHGSRGQVPVDTGFIVYNEVNYPLLTALFAELGVETIPSDMSFGVKIGSLEYSASSLAGLFAQKRNLASPGYWGMLRDILAFFREAPKVLDSSESPSLGELLTALGLGRRMRDQFLIPMGAAIWSTPALSVLDMPAKTFVRFFSNHNLLTVRDHHSWRTVKGGSRTYVGALMRELETRFGVTARVGDAVARIAPEPERRHRVALVSGTSDVFDEVVLACHADTARSLLAEPTPEENRILGAFTFRDNTAILHSDTSFMPKARNAWASWVYTADAANAGPSSVSITYWMNKLQSLDGAPLFVTLNPARPIAPEKIFDRHTFRHPMLSREAVAAQGLLHEIQGRRGLWFCGAWCRYGFHEDGLRSAADVAEARGGRLPWG